MFFVEAGRHQHLAMQNQFICDLSKGQNSFGIVLNIWVAGCLGGGTGKLAANGGNWRSKSLALLLMISTTLDGFYFANCVLAAVFFIFDYQRFRK